MDNQIIQIKLDDLKALVNSMISEEKIKEMQAKPQLTFTEACALYGEHRIRKFIKSKLLKPASQNGKGSKIYYDHFKIIQLVNNSYHYLTGIKLWKN